MRAMHGIRDAAPSSNLARVASSEPRSRGEKFGHPFQPRRVHRDDPHHGQYWNGQEEADRSPDPKPKYAAKEDRQRVKAKLLAEKNRIDQVALKAHQHGVDQRDDDWVAPPVVLQQRHQYRKEQPDRGPEVRNEMQECGGEPPDRRVVQTIKGKDGSNHDPENCVQQHAVEHVLLDIAMNLADDGKDSVLPLRVSTKEANQLAPVNTGLHEKKVEDEQGERRLTDEGYDADRRSEEELFPRHSLHSPHRSQLARHQRLAALLQLEELLGEGPPCGLQAVLVCLKLAREAVDLLHEHEHDQRRHRYGEQGASQRRKRPRRVEAPNQQLDHRMDRHRDECREYARQE